MRISPILSLLGLASLSVGQQFTLSDALRSARDRRPSLAAAAKRLSQAQLTSRSLGLAPATRLSLGYTTDPETGGSDDDLALTQPLDIFGRTSAMRRLGRAMLAEAQASYQGVWLLVQSEVVDAYLGYVSASAQARSALAVQAVYEQVHEATRLRVESGVVPGFHLMQVGLDLDQAKLQAEQLRAETDAARRKLESVTGLAIPQAVPTSFPELSSPSVDAAGIQQRLPDLLALKAQIQLAEADVAVARASNKPELELQGRRTPWQVRNGRYGLRLQLSIPLYDHGKAATEIRAGTLGAEAARQALQDATQLALGEIASAATVLATAQQQVDQYAELVSRAKDLVGRLRPALTEQATTLLEVLAATRALRDLELAYVDSRIRLASAQARLLKATGHTLEVKS